jgi:hypothetical protein
MTLPHDCKYLAYLSYANADDTALGGWVMRFRQEFERSLRPMVPEEAGRDLIVSANATLSGNLLDQVLRQQLESSFSMIVLVHDHHARSGFLQQELAYFTHVAAERGDDPRRLIYLVALSRPAMAELRRHTKWQDLLGDDAVWTTLFDDANPAQPIDAQLVNHAKPYARLVDRFRKDLSRSLRRMAQAIEPPPGIAPTRSAAPTGADGAGRVFVSHAEVDASWATTVVEGLESSGHDCWLAKRDIVPGAPSYSSEIAKAIKRARAMVVVLSEAAGSSPHVVREVTLAFDHGLPVLPLKIDKQPLSDAMAYFFSAGQMLLASDIPRADALQRLESALKHHPAR